MSATTKPFFKIRPEDKAVMLKMIANLQDDTTAVSSAIGFTLAMIVTTIIYIFKRFAYWPDLGDIIGLYTLANIILLVRFVYIRLTTEWTLDDIGHLVFHLTKKDE